MWVVLKVMKIRIVSQTSHRFGPCKKEHPCIQLVPDLVQQALC